MVNLKTKTGKTLILKTVFLALIIFSIIFHCSKLTPPDYTNPLDTENPETQGDPFELKAEVDNEEIFLSWNSVSMTAINGYKIFRKEIDERDFAVIGDTTAVAYMCIRFKKDCILHLNGYLLFGRSPNQLWSKYLWHF